MAQGKEAHGERAVSKAAGKLSQTGQARPPQHKGSKTLAPGSSRSLVGKGPVNSIASSKDKCMAPGEFFDHPDVIAAIRKGEEDIKAGRMSVYDPETGATKPYTTS